MDAPLAVFQGPASPLRKAAIAGETSRCSRCVKDKKGCDRRLPCTRCVETGFSHLCVYTGTIVTSRQRSTPVRTRSPMRSTLPRTNSSRSFTAGPDDGSEDETTTMSTPVASRQRKRSSRPGATTQSESRSRGTARRRHVAAAERQMDEEWYRKPPPRMESVADPEPEKSEEESMRLGILAGFTDIVTHLPIEIYRSTCFIRSLDQAYTTKTKRIDDLCRQLQHSPDVTGSLVLRNEICRLSASSRDDRAEAVAEVAKLQNLIESHITLLNAEVGKVKDSDPHKLSRPSTRDSKANNDNNNNDNNDGQNPLDPTGPIKKRRRRRNTDTVTPNDAKDGIDVPIDDDEPRYCYCHRVSFGKMIACENESCEGGEWFHFDCLGITRPPRGKWWCRKCTARGFSTRRYGRNLGGVSASGGVDGVDGEGQLEGGGKVSEESGIESRASIKENEHEEEGDVEEEEGKGSSNHVETRGTMRTRRHPRQPRWTF